jgi:hypothetical protein
MAGPLMKRATYISPNWLKVERATTFLASISIKAANLATNKVSKPKTKKKIILTKDVLVKRIINQIPAVTKVELWTKALTGVGAAIAAGNQLEKGSWALFVKERRTKKIKAYKLIILLKEDTLITSQ